MGVQTPNYPPPPKITLMANAWLCSTPLYVPVCDRLVKHLPYSFYQEQYWSKVDDYLVARVNSAHELIMIHGNLLSAHNIVFSGEDLSVMIKDLLVFLHMPVVWSAVWLYL